MRRRYVNCVTLLACGLGLAVQGALAADEPARASAKSEAFVKVDTNRDGYISRQEAKHVPGLSKAFDEADDNRDGRLDPDEFIKAEAIRHREQAAGFVGDSVITAKVKAMLFKDAKLKALDVSVETRGGEVYLSGFADDQTQIDKVIRTASSVSGVTNVKSSLAVR